MTVRRLLFAFTFTLLITSAPISAAQELPERRLGDRPPTPEEQAYIDAVYTEVTRVAPNDLARARVWAEIEAAVARGDKAPAPDGLPTVVDNSTLQYFPPIRSQGNQGSCTCWAACYYYNTYTQAVDEGYDVSGGNNDYICSPAFMYPLVNGGQDLGANTQYVVGRLNDVGCSSWTLKPYSDLDYTSWPSEAAWIQALQNRTQTAHTINGSTQPGLDAIKQHLANGNLAATRFTVYNTWHIYYPDNSKTGIDNDVYYYPDGGAAGGHAVTLVGYDDNRSYVDHRDAQTHYGAFLLANSWGNGWGVQNSTGSGTNGFFWVAYEMFLESTFGPNAYYNDDRADYRPALYAVVGVNHPSRWDVILQGGVVSSPDWQSYYPIYYDGGDLEPVTDADRIAIDLSDGIPSIPSTPPTTAFVRVYDYHTSSYDATITSADFYEDFDGDGSYALDSSTDPTVTINPATWGYAYAVIHDFSVSALDPSPSTVPSGGTASLSATYSDSDGHGVASWSWDDGGAGGSFSPSATEQNPTYNAPANTTDSNLIVTLTVNASCDGPAPLGDDDSTSLTVEPVAHTLEVTAGTPVPDTVPSGGSTDLSATFSDSRSGHGVAYWSWDDGGAGGSFSPSATEQNPTYNAPANTTDANLIVTLTVNATCDGPAPLGDDDSTTLPVEPVAHTFEVTADLPSPDTVPSAGSTNLSATFSDSRSGHGVAYWSWDDGGAGGSFSPSATEQNPSYAAPANTSDSNLEVTLTVNATCDGPAPLGDDDSTTLTVEPVAHTFEVTADLPSPDTVPSAGSTNLSATFSDSRSGHGVAYWSWDDGGAGGTFLPSADVQNPTYIAPDNTTGSDLILTLTVTATCDGPSPLIDSESAILTVHPDSAEAVIEAWRSPFGSPRSVSVNPADGSCWAATGASVMHLATDGSVLSQTNGFWMPGSVSVNPTDGSCWVADMHNNQVVHLSAGGTELWRGGGFSSPQSVSVNPTDGSCWVADYGNDQVAHLSAGGAELWRGGGFDSPKSVSVNPTDGSCWVADYRNNQVVHLSAGGAELWRGGGLNEPWSVSVNPTDASCWVADRYSNQVVHLAEDGTELWRGGGFASCLCVSVNPTDGSCWVGERGKVVHLSAGGAELWRGGGFNGPMSVSVNPTDGSCWVADSWNNQVAHLSPGGAELWRGGGFNGPMSVSVNPTDGSCWVADTYNGPESIGQVVHLSAGGAELWRGVFSEPWSVSVNPTDGSCWVAESWSSGQVVHLSAGGAELWRGGGFNNAQSVSVNPTDGSCWVADTHNNQVVHLSAGGAELWRGGAFGWPMSVSVNPTDGSCWVADYFNNQVVHLSAGGAELWRGGAFFCGPQSVSVNPTDGSCWVADSCSNGVAHFSAGGTELWMGWGFDMPWSVSVNPTDGSYWVADSRNGQVVHLVPSPYPYCALIVTGSNGQVMVDGVPHRVAWAGAFTPDTTLTLEAVPDSCYEFTGWSGDLTGAENPTTLTMDADKSVTANFAFMQHPLDLTGAGSGSVEVDAVPHALPWSDLFDCGPTLTLEAVPDGGWLFSSWTGDLTGTTNPDTITMDSDNNITANFILHTFEVTANLPVPDTVGSGGSADLSATYSDSGGHGITSWFWDDAGAGGSFSLSATEQNPTYTAPANTSDSNLIVTLTVNATCDGPAPLGDDDSTTLTVEPVAHTFEVYASADPSIIESGGTSSLTGNYSDSRSGHSVASWLWDDGGAGGNFSPSATEQNPTYTAPMNLTGADLVINLTLEATCDGTPPLLDTDSTTLTVLPIPIPEVLLEIHPNERAPGASDPQFLGWDPWTQPTSSPANSYWWKKYEFYSNGPLWIQVCAQNWDKWQKGYASDDNTWLEVNGIRPADYDAIQNGPPGGWQWVGSKENGQRWTLCFLHLGPPGKHSLWIGADESPVLWWIKVTDLEPGVIEAIE